LVGRRPFHWPLEFPEVFVVELEEERGFAAIVSNPPFQGGQKIAGPLGRNYRDYLIAYVADNKRGNADLCAYFFLRASQLEHQDGMCGLLATNTIAQGDTREVGLEQIISRGWSIIRAISSRKWPGTASLEVSHIWLRNGGWGDFYILDDMKVEGITSLLIPKSNVQGKHHRLIANFGKSFIGTYLLGIGFVVTSEEAETLIKTDPRNRDVLYPYLNGEDINSRFDQSPSRWVINFHELPLKQAESYPDCMDIVKEKVLSQRETGTKFARKEWWLFERTRPALYNAIANMQRVLVTTIVTSYLAPVFCPTGWIYAHRCCVFPLDDFASYSLIQSNI
ncbi:MAG TPA: DNA methyltransferase, partial [Methylomirabilota bacterium]|nr:DNA methyltransferase [Methylomirabilota bacterium]